MPLRDDPLDEMIAGLESALPATSQPQWPMDEPCGLEPESRRPDGRPTLTPRSDAP